MSASTTESSTTRTLDSIPIGEKVVVKSVSAANPSLCRRLLTMGIVAGTLIEVLRVAPLGDPIKVRALGYKLSLRISEASSVEVLPLQ